MKTRIVFIEFKNKGAGLAGPARIGRVTFSRSGSSVYYRGRRFETLDGTGYKANYADAETGEHVWISGPKKRGDDTLYPGVVQIDDDVREEYWLKIRGEPDRVADTSFRSEGKHARRRPK